MNKLLILLVGVNNYESKSLKNLRYCSKDCQQLAEALEIANQNLEQKIIIVHHEINQDYPPRFREVNQSLNTLINQADRNSTIIFYFAGHGLIKDNNTPILCLQDTQPESGDNSLSLAKLLEIISQSQASQQIVIIDACHSGGVNFQNILVNRASSFEGFYSILSCTEQQKSLEDEQLQHGLFTYYLIQGIKGKAANQNQEIELDTLYQYLSQSIRQRIGQLNERIRFSHLGLPCQDQTPLRMVRSTAKFIIGSQSSPQYNHRQAIIIDEYYHQNLNDLANNLRYYGKFYVSYFDQLPKSSKTSGVTFLYQRVKTIDIDWLFNNQQQVIILDLDPEGDNLDNISLDNLTTTLDHQCIIIGYNLLEKLNKILSQQQLTTVGLIKELIGDRLNFKYWLSPGVNTLNILTSEEEIVTNNPLNICPYKGLKTFTKQDSFFFCGRQDLQGEIINKITTTSFLAVIGPSGSGKSSLIQGGVIPQLEKQGYLVKIIRPRMYHLDSDNPTNLILVIDQFEELFSLYSQEDRDRFLDLILDNPPKFKIIITMRSDFLNNCLDIPRLDFILQSYILIPSYLSQREYREIIVEPVRKSNASIEPVLVQSLLQEIENQPGSLPLLELALEKLWENSPEGNLTLSTYREKVGGIQNLLEKIANQTYQQLSPLQQSCTQWIFLSLVNLGEGEKDTRRRLHLEDLKTPRYPLPLIQDTLEKLITAKLIIATCETNQPIYEITHEVLITHWSKLREWLEKRRPQLIIARETEQSARKWYDNQQNKDFFLKGLPLTLAEEVLENVTIDTQAYIKASRQHSDRSIQQELKTAKTITTVAVIGSVIITSLGLIVNHQRILAERRELEASLNLEIEQLEDVLTSSSVEVLVETIRIVGKSYQHLGEVSPILENKLWEVTNQVKEVNIFSKDLDIITSVNFSPNGELIVSGGKDNKVRLWNLQGELIKTFGHEHEVTSVNFSPNGELIVSGGKDNKVRLWNLQGELIKTFPHQDEVTSVNFSPNGELIVSGGKDNKVRLWNLQGELIKTFGHEHEVTSVNFSPDGELIVSGGKDNKVRLWNLNNPQDNRIFPHQGWVNSVGISSDGNFLVTGSQDENIKGIVTLWSITGELIDTFTGHQSWVNSVAISPDHQFILSGSQDQTIRLWQKNSQLTDTFTGHENEVTSVTFSFDGELILSGSKDNTLRLWDVEGNLKTILPTDDDRGIDSVKFSENQRYVLASNDHGIIYQWDLLNNNSLSTFQPYRFNQIILSPDGQYLLTGNDDTTIRIWNQQGRLLHTLKGHQSEITSLAMSLDGKLIVSGDRQGTINLWQSTGKLEYTLTTNQTEITSLAFHPNQPVILVGTVEGRILFINIQGDLLKTIKPHNTAIELVTFSPNGQYFLSQARDKTVYFSLLNSHLKDNYNAIAFSQDSQYLALGNSQGDIHLWNMDTNLITTLSNQVSQINSLVFSPDGRYLLSGHQNKNLVLWNLQSDQPPVIFTAHTDAITTVIFSPNNQYILSTNYDQNVRLWSLKGNQICQLNQHKNHLKKLAFTPDNRYIISGDSRFIYVSDLNCNVVKTIISHQNFTQTLPLSINSTSWLITDKENNVYFVNNKGKVIYALSLFARDYPNLTINNIGISSDNSQIITSDNSGHLYLWNLQGDLVTHTNLKQHQEAVTSVAFSHDDHYFLTGSLDTTVKLWQIQTGELVLRDTFNSHRNHITSVYFVNKKQKLFISASKNMIYLSELKGLNIKQFNYNYHDTINFTDLAYNPKNNYLIAGSRDNTLRLIKVSNWLQLLTISCQRLANHPLLTSQGANVCLELVLK